MKKLKIALLVAMILVTATLIGFTNKTENAIASTDMSQVTKNIITVNGEGVVKVKPDIAYISVGIETTDKSVDIAQSNNKEKMNSLYDALKKVEIKEDNIKTISYNVYPDYQYDKNTGNNKAVGFKVANIVEVTISDINSTGKVIDTVSKNSTNIINSIRFGTSNSEDAYLKALKIAVENSKTKATTISDVFNAKNVKPVKVTEISNSNSNPHPMYEMAKMADSASTPISSGDLEIKAVVTVDYEY